MDEDIVVNVDFEGAFDEKISNSIQVVPVNIAWEDFELMLKVYAGQDYIQVYYIDEEDELIKVNSHDELQQAFLVAKFCNNTLHLKVQCSVVPPVEVEFIEAKSPPAITVSDDFSEQINADIKNQTVSMINIQRVVDIAEKDIDEKNIEKFIPLPNVNDNKEVNEIPIVMETGETNDPSCDWLVAKETGEKQPRVVVDDKGAKMKDSVKDRTTEEKKIQHHNTGSHKKYFFLKHKASNLVLDVFGGNPHPETPVIVYTKKNGNTDDVGNQLWYVDKNTSTIKSKFNGLCLDASENGVKMAKHVEGKSSQMWVINGSKINHKFNSNWVIGLPEVPAIRPACRVIACEHRNDLEWIVEYRSSNGCKAQGKNNKDKSPVMPSNDYYSELASAVGASAMKCEEKATTTATQAAMPCDDDSGETEDLWLARDIPTIPLIPRRVPVVPPRLGVQGKAPKWFADYMVNFQKEMIQKTSESIANKTVDKVLRGLEGAVITSVHSNQSLGKPACSPVNNRSEPLQQSNDRQVYHHYGIICDGCDQEIVGVRYKCGNCADYDLCQNCEAVDGLHKSDHVFLKIYKPVMTAGRKRDGSLVPLMKFNIYQHEETLVKQIQRESEKDKLEKDVKQQKNQQQTPRPAVKDPVEKLKKKQEKLKKKGEKIEEKIKRKEKRRMANDKVLPQKKEKLELPQYGVPDRMDAELQCHDTFPDGTHVQPGSTLVKRWVMKNTGTSPWVTGTKLVMIWGNMKPQKEEVDVPFTAVDESALVSVVLKAPVEPGTYQSHWRMNYCGLRFGKRVWCSIVVDPKEILEQKPHSAVDDLPLKDLKLCCDSKEKSSPEKGDNADATEQKEKKENSLLDYEDLMILARSPDTGMELDMIEAHSYRLDAKQSQTATPNNTPLESRDVTPPKSPLPTPRERLWSNSSSVEIVGENDGNDFGQGSEISEELVQERMANLGLKPDIDLESISSFEDEDSSGSDSDSDFFVVPIPDCFNPNLPASKLASTSLYVRKDEMQSSSERAVDEMLTASQKLETQPLLATSGAEYEALETADGEQEESNSVEPQPLLSPTSTTFNYQPLDLTNHEEDVYKSADDELVTDEQENNETEANDQIVDELSVTNDVSNDQQTIAKEYDNYAESETVESHIDPVTVEGATQTQTQVPTDMAAVLVNQAIGYASKATTTAYKTCKDVFHTLQARNQYVPKQSQWIPKENNYTPPSEQWTPPAQQNEAWTHIITDDDNWEPPRPSTPPIDMTAAPVDMTTNTTTGPQQSSPTTQAVTASSTTVSTPPMEQLLEMGFADRRQNDSLLKKHGDDVGKVVQELLSLQDNDWHSNRH